MDTEFKLHFIRDKACQNQRDYRGTCVLWSRHAIIELVADNLTRYQVEKALQQAEMIEDYPHLYRPLPDCLVLGWVSSQEPIHAVVAVDMELDRILIVTVYRPSKEEWKDDWRTRT